MNEHILDRPIWNSLNTVHAPFAEGNCHARRFAEGVTSFAAAKDESAESLKSLADLVPEHEGLFVGQASPIIIPDGTRASDSGEGAQMILTEPTDNPKPEDHRIERLTQADVPEMLALATLTKPGPFQRRTHVLGRYWGVKENGQLIAMAGERFKNPGYTEISTVCTHPDHIGRGLAHGLCWKVAQEILVRGEIPYLHVFSTNYRAIKVYENLGFRVRRLINSVVLERA